jgi:hypothetical protein
MEERMASLMDVLGDSLDRRTVSQIGNQLGVDQETAQSAISAAIPMIVAGLARNASRPDGADALHGALSRDHDGSLLDDLGGFLGRGGGGMGGGIGGAILGHVFGGRQRTMENTLGRSTGLDGATAARLLAMLAPIVMAALSKARTQNNLDSGGLTDLLGGERARMQRASPDGFGLLNGLLDQDGDGKVDDGIAQMGGSLLGSLFGRR